MTQPTLFDALREQASGSRQVINKEKENEKEKSPHTPLKGKEKVKETSTTTCCLPSEYSLSRARARDQQVGVVALTMKEKCQGLIVSADTLNAAHAFMTRMMVYFRVPPNVVNLHLGDVKYLDERDYPSEWDRLMSRHVYLLGLGSEFLPGHYNAEALKVAAFLRQYLRPGRNAAAHRLLISTRLSSAGMARRYGQDVLQLVLMACHPVKLRTRKEVLL